jgi:hypothetical protein
VAIASFIPVIGSRFAAEGNVTLCHSGRLTEDYAYVIHEDGSRVPANSLGKNQAADALEEVLTRREDLRVSAFLADEIRLHLCARNGPDFAQRAVGTSAGTLSVDLARVIAQRRRERIERRAPGI